MNAEELVFFADRYVEILTGRAFDPSGERLYVANGTQNAILVIEFEPEQRGESHIRGLIPVGWFPGAIPGSAASQKMERVAQLVELVA